MVIFGALEALEQQFESIYTRASADIESLRIPKTEPLQVHYRSWTESRRVEPAKIVLSKL